MHFTLQTGASGHKPYSVKQSHSHETLPGQPSAAHRSPTSHIPCYKLVQQGALTSSFFCSSVLWVAAYTWKLPYFDCLTGSVGTMLTVNSTLVHSPLSTVHWYTHHADCQQYTGTLTIVNSTLVHSPCSLSTVHSPLSTVHWYTHHADCQQYSGTLTMLTVNNTLVHSPCSLSTAHWYTRHAHCQ